MRLVARLLIAAAVVVVLTAAYVFWAATADPVHTTARDVVANPRQFDGATVVISTSPLEEDADGRLLVYRRIAGRPPTLVVELTDRPARRPSYVAGRVQAGNPIRITAAHPAQSP
jgi:hypothetical protein